MNVVIPLRIIITAIAVNRRLLTFATAFVPPSPNIFMTKLECLKENQTITRFRASPKVVVKVPCRSAKSIKVVKAAGPMIRGMPIGTTPSCFDGALCVSFEGGNNKSDIDRTRRTSPPPTLKSEEVIPKKAKISLPKNIKHNETISAVAVAWVIKVFRSSAATPSVIDMNNGITLATLMATKSGIKHCSKSVNILPRSCYKRMNRLCRLSC